MKNQGGFLSIILTIVVAMVLMSGGAYVWYKSDIGKDVKNNVPKVEKVEVIEEEEKSEEKDDWSTYNNEDYGFMFKYPDGVSIEERDSLIVVSNKEGSKKAEELQTWFPPEFTIDKISDDQIEITKEWLDKKNSSLTLQDYKEPIGGRDVFVALPTELATKTFIFSNSNGTFMIYAWGHNKNGYYADVMKTFNFLEESNEDAVDISEWKTYEDNDFGISFKYPNDPWRGFEVTENSITINQEHPGFGMNIRKLSSYPDSDTQNIVISRSNKIINNLSYKEYYRQEAGSSSYGYILADENFGSYYMFNSSWGPDNELFEQIMETVSLAKVIPSGPTSNWQFYDDKKFDYDFSYPENWNLEEHYGAYLLSPEKIVHKEIGSNNAPIRFGVYSSNKDIFLRNDYVLSFDNKQYHIDNDKRNQQDSVEIINGKKFDKYDLIDYGQYEGDSAGNIIMFVSHDSLSSSNDVKLVFTWEERPGNTDLDNNKKLKVFITSA